MLPAAIACGIKPVIDADEVGAGIQQQVQPTPGAPNTADPELTARLPHMDHWHHQLFVLNAPAVHCDLPDDPLRYHPGPAHVLQQ